MNSAEARRSGFAFVPSKGCRGELTNLCDVVEVSGNKVCMKYVPSDLIAVRRWSAPKFLVAQLWIATAARASGAREAGRGGEQASRAVASEELDPRGVSAGGGEGRVPCHEGSRQRFREGDVGRIVRRDVVPELPDPGQQHVVRVATQGQRGEVLQRLGAARGVELRGERVSAQDLGHFEIQQVGSVQRWTQRSQAGEVSSEHQYSWRVRSRRFVPPRDRPASVTPD